MSRIDETMAALGRAKRKALVAYLCIGDPSQEESIEHALACANAGADILELGVPFSDPTADGAAIAKASQRSLAAGGGLGRAIEAAAAIRKRTEVPLLLFGYYNPIFIRGEEATLHAARAAGVDGFLIVDLPVEEAPHLRALCKDLNLSLVPLLTPTSSPARIEKAKLALTECAPGFVYYVSMTGVTGSGDAPLAEASTRARELRSSLGVPIVIGFGIDSPEKARLAAEGSDGVVVGSAIVRAIERGENPGELVATLRRAID